MAWTQNDFIRPAHRRVLWLTPTGPLSVYAISAFLGAGVVAGLGGLLANWNIAAVIAAMTLYTSAALTAGWALHRVYPHDRLGLCNKVTLGRLVMVGALIVPLMAGFGPSWAIFAVASLALALDGVDGWLARRDGLVSNFGARFDMEVDSALALVLSLHAAFGTEVGLAAAVLGLPRYVFGAAGLALPWMQRALPDRFSRKVVCVVQLGSLIALQAPILPPTMAVLLMAVAGVALLWSFAVDVVWLWQRWI